MTNVLEIAKMQAAQQAPAITEKAQIAIHYREPHPSLVFRFNTLKKGEVEYAKLILAWKEFNTFTYSGKGRKDPLHYVNADMFVGWVDLGAISAAMLIDHKKRDKFVPVQ